MSGVLFLLALCNETNSVLFMFYLAIYVKAVFFGLLTPLLALSSPVERLNIGSPFISGNTPSFRCGSKETL